MDEEETSAGGFSLMALADEHGPLLLALGVVAALLLAYRFMKSAGASGTSSSNTSTSSLAQGDLSGLQTDANGNPIVYVPTSTEFYTDNSVNATSAQGAPATITENSPVTTTTVNAPVTTTVNPPAPPPVVPPILPGPPPVRQPPVDIPPPVHNGALVWDQTFRVLGGENLSVIAAEVTSQVRGQGAPSTVRVTYQDIYAHNQTVIDNTSAQHGNPIPGGPQNNIFPGEPLIVPRWVAN